VRKNLLAWPKEGSIVMTDETRKALQLFIEKSDKLRSLQFLTTFSELSFHWNTTKGEEKLEITGPTQEQLDAFVLTFRFFVQDNEHTSLRWLAKHVGDDPDVSGHWKQEFNAVRGELNNILDSWPPIQVSIANYMPPTWRDVMEAFIYGDLSHANEKKREIFKSWMRDLPTKGLLTVQFVQIVSAITAGLFHIAEITKKELCPDLP
jgi:hypothetical protein